jgi:predicted nucleotidyltransferase
MNKKKKHFISKLKKEEIINTISSHLNQHNEIYAAYLFGSFVTSESFADIDLGVLTRPRPENIFEYEIELERYIEKRSKYEMDVRVLNKAPISFVQDVIRYGKVIVDSKPNRRAEFESYTLRKYFDFARFRQRYLSEVINAPI